MFVTTFFKVMVASIKLMFFRFSIVVKTVDVFCGHVSLEHPPFRDHPVKEATCSGSLHSSGYWLASLYKQHFCMFAFLRAGHSEGRCLSWEPYHHRSHGRDRPKRTRHGRKRQPSQVLSQVGTPRRGFAATSCESRRGK